MIVQYTEKYDEVLTSYFLQPLKSNPQDAKCTKKNKNKRMRTANATAMSDSYCRPVTKRATAPSPTWRKKWNDLTQSYATAMSDSLASYWKSYTALSARSRKVVSKNQIQNRTFVEEEGRQERREGRGKTSETVVKK